jgi:hypothetical protein
VADTTSFQCHVYSCPPGERAAALAVLAESGLHLDEDSERPEDGCALSLTGCYVRDDIRTGAGPRIAGKLRRAAPGCSFMCWEDPQPAWDGHIEAHTPRLGSFAASCDVDGMTIATLSEITALITAAAATPRDGCLAGYVPADAILTVLGRRMGGPWYRDRNSAVAGQAARLEAASGSEDTPPGHTIQEAASR